MLKLRIYERGSGVLVNRRLRSGFFSHCEVMSLKDYMRGEIQLIVGPMFSGKTTELMRRINRYGIAKNKCMIIKYANDQRYDVNEGILTTHDRKRMAAVSAVKLFDLADLSNDFGVVGIDEGQFFPDLARFCDHLANKGKIVIVAALNGTFQRQPFEGVTQLFPLCENIQMLTAVCDNCGNEASFTHRRGNELQLEIIGGEDKYYAACRQCGNRENGMTNEYF